MAFRRIWVLFQARNREFIRDRAGFGWNILFPFLIVAGFGLIYSDSTRQSFKAGLVQPPAGQVALSQTELPRTELSRTELSTALPHRLKTSPLLTWVSFDSKETALDRLAHHKVDILVEAGHDRLWYWINEASPKGEVAEKVVREAMLDPGAFDPYIQKQMVHGTRIRYLDWLFPGVLGMNIMFSAFYGVSYVVARYRRMGVLKRLKATPVTAFEYLTAQLLSRVAVLGFSTMVVWVGCDLIFGFDIQGPLLDLAAVFLAGICCMTCLGLALACRGTNEELINGIINFICWPMMFLSEVWFSIEGAAPWVKAIARFLPLTPFLEAARRVMNDGATLSQVAPELTFMAWISLVSLVIGSLFFSWTR